MIEKEHDNNQLLFSIGHFSVPDKVQNKKLLTEKAEEDAKRRSGDACALCGSEKLLFEPPVFYCNGLKCTSARIRRNSYYYVGGNNKYHCCCFLSKHLRISRDGIQPLAAKVESIKKLPGVLFVVLLV